MDKMKDNLDKGGIENIKEFDLKLEKLVVRLTERKNIDRFLMNSKKLLKESKLPNEPLDYNIVSIQYATYKKVYEKYSSMFGEQQKRKFNKELKRLEFILDYMERQKEKYI